MKALTRAQIALEYSAYQLAAPSAPVYAKTPDFITHQLFVGAVEAIAGAVFSAAFAWLLRR